MTKDCLYFIRATESGLIKIGHSASPEQRLKALQRRSQEPLEFLFIGTGGREWEQRLHESFKADRVYGEWFRPTPGLLDAIEHLKKMQAKNRIWNDVLTERAKEAASEHWLTCKSDDEASYIDGFMMGYYRAVNDHFDKVLEQRTEERSRLPQAEAAS